MDALLKKYAERIEMMISNQPSIRTRWIHIERLLLQFLIEYIEFRENQRRLNDQTN